MRLIWLGTHCSDCYLQESGYGRRVPLWNLFGCRGHWMYNQCPAPCNCVTECRQLTSNALFARPALRKAEDDARNISQVSKARLDAALGILTWWWQGGWTGCRRSLKVPSNSGDSSVLRFSYTQHRSKNLVSSCLQFVFIVKVYFRIFTEEMKLFFFLKKKNNFFKHRSFQQNGNSKCWQIFLHILACCPDFGLPLCLYLFLYV